MGTALRHRYPSKGTSMTQEALKLALEFIENSECGTADLEARIKEALAQEQEPVAWFRYQQGSRVYYDSKKWDDCQPLYTSPPQRTQVDLTDEEVFGLFGRFTAMTGKSWLDLYRMTEAKRKEKNT